MRLQGMSILYVLFVLPIILILSITINSYMNTIEMKNEYNEKLLGATQDAIKAFEINTAVEDFRNISDALKPIVEASINTFKDSFANRVGMGGTYRSIVEQYIPFSIFTLNDGYYIDSPSYVPLVAKYNNGRAVTVDSPGYEDNGTYNENFWYSYQKSVTEYPESLPAGTKRPILSHDSKPVLFQRKQANPQDAVDNDIQEGTINPFENTDQVYFDRSTVLKNFIPYSARYVAGDINVVISYSMDNYLSIIGQVGADKFVSRSGYLMDGPIVRNFKVKVNGNENNILNKGGHDRAIDETIDRLSNGVITIEMPGYIREYDKVINFEDVLTTNVETGDVTIKYRANSNKIVDTNTEHEYQKQQRDAIKHYLKSYYFSKWVYETLDNIKMDMVQFDFPDDILDSDKISEAFITPRADNQTLFDESIYLSGKNSDYTYHKKMVMRNSIQYNFFVAAYNYTKIAQTESLSDFDNVFLQQDPRIPILTDVEWDNVLSNISYITFCQGFPVGMQKFNDYAVVSSNDNPFTIREDGLYFVQMNGFDKGELPSAHNKIGESIDYNYHKISCDAITKQLQGVSDPQLTPNTQYVGDLINRFVYDGKKKKAAEIAASANRGEIEYSRKNFQHFGCIVDPAASEHAVNPLGNEKLSILASAIGAKKEQRYNRITIKDGAEYTKTTYSPNIGSSETGIGEFNGDITSHIPIIDTRRTVKSIDITVSPTLINAGTEIDQQIKDRNTVEYDVIYTIGDAQYTQTWSIGTAQAGNDNINIYRTLTLDNMKPDFKSDEKIKNIGTTSLTGTGEIAYGDGQVVRVIVFEKQPPPSSGVTIAESPTIKEIRINYQ